MKGEPEVQNLEDASEWDYEAAQSRPGVKPGRVVVSVAFSRSDFDLVVETAQHLGMKTSEFIREAALEEVDRHKELVSLFSFSGSLGSGVLSDRLLPTTRGPTEVRPREEPTAVTV